MSRKWIDKEAGIFQEEPSWHPGGIFRLEICDRCGGDGEYGDGETAGVCYRCDGSGDMHIPMVEGIGGRLVDLDSHEEESSEPYYGNEYHDYDVDRYAGQNEDALYADQDPNPIPPPEEPPTPEITADDIPF